VNFDPQKFFIGLMAFFSILRPDALLTYLVMGEVEPVLLGERHAKFADAEAWAAFLFASYLFTHGLSFTDPTGAVTFRKGVTPWLPFRRPG
jgi:hypothetical protein